MQGADLCLLSSDFVRFLVYTNILFLISPVFADMVTLGKPIHSHPLEDENAAPVVSVSEDSKTLDAFLRLIYPVESPAFTTLGEVQDVLEATLKYQGNSVIMKPVTDALHSFLPTHALSIFAIACRFDLESEARIAAIAAGLDPRRPTTNFGYVAEMDHISAGAYFRLRWYFWRGPTHDADRRDVYWRRFSFINRNPADCVLPRKLETYNTTKTANADAATTVDVLTTWLGFGLFKRRPADLILRSSDGVAFSAHGFSLSISSPVLARQIEELSASLTESLPVVDVPEPSPLLYLLLCSCYGIPLQLVKGGNGQAVSLSQLSKLVHVARKYGMTRTVDQARMLFRCSLKDEPLRAYFIAVSLGWHSEAQTAARLAVTESSISYVYTPSMEDVSAKAYYNLLQYDVDVQCAADAVVQRYSAKRTLNSGWYPQDSGRTLPELRTFIVHRSTDKLFHTIAQREFGYMKDGKGGDVYMPNLLAESRNMEVELQAAINQVELAFN
ncbi:hypothetical protein EUX98_g4495 [Antrodiella citrinella]|uniref:BTB domain-containing protein n=1 Tax=Antrodiella citrinella TaxID=2447956 RepID=A0A4S4MTS9_9APHY|nr:hypothetical protein EUX98_g4495 [Antrodiella citrinella]